MWPARSNQIQSTPRWRLAAPQSAIVNRQSSSPARTFYLKPYLHTSAPPLLVVHGVLFTSCIVVVVAQTVLVAAHRTPVHRRLGWIGAAAVYYRRRPDIHKRLVIIATLAVLPAAFARWPLAFTQRQDLLVAFGPTSAS